jgi:hypothetical protein
MCKQLFGLLEQVTKLTIDHVEIGTAERPKSVQHAFYAWLFTGYCACMVATHPDTDELAGVPETQSARVISSELFLSESYGAR